MQWSRPVSSTRHAPHTIHPVVSVYLGPPNWCARPLSCSKVDKFVPRSLHGNLGIALDPQPSTLNPQPSTLSPQPSTLNPQPSTLNPPPSTLHPQPSTLHPQPSTPNPTCRRGYLPPMSGIKCSEGSRCEGPCGGEEGSYLRLIDFCITQL